jgi:ribonuclease P protein component
MPQPASTGGARFPRAARILDHAGFERVYKEGRRHFAAHLTVFYRPRPQGSGMRIGLTVSKALGGAVERNRIRRRLREAVRHCRPVIAPAMDVVINPKKSALKVDFAVLLEEVARAFDQVMGRKPGAIR